MISHLLCPACGVPQPLPKEDVQMGWFQRLVPIIAMKPKNHCIHVNGERIDVPGLICDLCNASIPNLTPAVCRTLWRGDEMPGPWEDQFRAQPPDSGATQ